MYGGADAMQRHPIPHVRFTAFAFAGGALAQMPLGGAAA